MLPREAGRAAHSRRRADRPGARPGTGGPPAIGGEDKRGRSGSRTWLLYSPRATGRGGPVAEFEDVALERGRLDAVIAGLLFMAGMQRSEVSALRWADVADPIDGDGFLVTVPRSKTNQEGEVNDVRFVKDGVGARDPDTTRRRESGSRATTWCRCQRRWSGCDLRRRRRPPVSRAG